MNYFYEPVNIKLDKNDEIFFWGCLHAYHNRDFIYGPRNFKSEPEHTETLISRWNTESYDVKGHLSGVLLGDTMFGNGGLSGFEELLDKLEFDDMYILGGNHTAGFKQAVNEHGEHFQQDGRNVYLLPNYFELKIGKQLICLSHYPILSWNKMSKGSWMLYSHVHNNLCRSELGKMFKSSELKQYETSVECNPIPVTFSRLKAMMNNKLGDSVDHHG